MTWKTLRDALEMAAACGFDTGEGVAGTTPQPVKRAEAEDVSADGRAFFMEALDALNDGKQLVASNAVRGVAHDGPSIVPLTGVNLTRCPQSPIAASTASSRALTASMSG